MQPIDQQSPVSIRTWLGFSLMGLGMFMAILDIQVVATSLPTIQRALRVRPDQMSWVQTAYLVAEVIAIPLTGFLTRLLTLRWLFVIAVSLFTLASIGCASSASFDTLIAFRVLQGFSGGTLIPAVFSAVFLLFPSRLQGVATTIAGVLAVLAPTVGPIGGGWITQSFSWHWLFLINVLPGFIAALGAVALLPRGRIDLTVARVFDPIALGLMAVALAALEIGLKEAPGRGWGSPLVIGLMGVSLASAVGFVRRSLGDEKPVVDLTTLRDRNFALGCGLSFVLGIGLFGSVYMMPVFLALVRGHDALQIGEIMLLTGIAQLITAPIAVALERRVDVRVLTGFGFLVFGTGLGMSAFQTEQTDFAQMIWPQIVRGSAVMFCLLPPTRLALGNLETARVADASGLFNLMRNLGGAIGLALIDTVIYGRGPAHANAIIAQLKAGNIDTARQVGIPVAIFQAHAHAPIDPRTAAMLQPMIQKLSLVQAINDAWALVAILTLCALATVPFAKPQPLDTEGEAAVFLGLVE
jgi:DHA2 family multidrug resistance protein